MAFLSQSTMILVGPNLSEKTGPYSLAHSLNLSHMSVSWQAKTSFIVGSLVMKPRRGYLMEISKDWNRRRALGHARVTAADLQEAIDGRREEDPHSDQNISADELQRHGSCNA